MALRNFSSTAAETTLSAGVTASATTLTVAATTGFPPAPFILAVSAGAAAQELVLVTAVAGTNLTVTRGYDSTVASAHNAGAVIQASHAALDFREANSHVNASTGVHGITGAVVGTTDAQTLANKTLDLAGFAYTNGAWTAITPSVINLPLNAVNSMHRFQRFGNKITGEFYLEASGPGTGTYSLELPTPARAFIGGGHPKSIGSAFLNDVGTGNFTALIYLSTTSRANFFNISPVAVAGTTTPFTWVAGDVIAGSYTYEAA